MGYNAYSFLRIYTDSVNQRANPNSMENLYWFLKDRTEGTEFAKYFDSPSPTQLDCTIAIDAVAHSIHQRGDEALQKVFPGANMLIMKSALDSLSGMDVENEVRKLNRGYFTSLFDDDPGLFLLEKQQVGKTTREDILPAIEEYKKLYKAGLASPAEILTLSRFYPDHDVYQKMILEKELGEEENHPMVIGGPASVEMIDKQGHLITTEALEKAFDNYLSNFRTRNCMILHSNVQSGWALPAFITASGAVFKSGVDDKGLYLIAELRDDIVIAKRVKDEVEKGRLRSYSIAGSATEIQNMQKGGQSYVEVRALDLAEVTLCEKGVNQAAHFEILKGDTASIEKMSLERPEWSQRDLIDIGVENYGVVLEKGENESDVVVICANKPNTFTESIYLELRKQLPSNIPIEVRDVPLGEWKPLFELRMEALDKGVNEGFGYNSMERFLKDHPEYDTDDFQESVLIEKDEDLDISSLEKLVGFVTLGMSDGSRTILPGFNLVKGGDSMPRDEKLKDLLEWTKKEKARRKLHRDTLDYQGYPTDKEFDDEWEIDQEDFDDEDDRAETVKI